MSAHSVHGLLLFHLQHGTGARGRHWKQHTNTRLRQETQPGADNPLPSPKPQVSFAHAFTLTWSTLLFLVSSSTDLLCIWGMSKTSLVFNLLKFSQVTSLLRTLHWLPLEAHIILKTLVLSYGAARGNPPLLTFRLFSNPIP